ncbi:collagen alpha-1(XXVIII) chain [Corchorus olitorius]|uniref:Collagen alpha-1(XXVIII) chain n=1 Tax=Corchorus olitorius TaxID=93759 RepID=A0A1R3K9I1_9ROSI|nr:collagen alpha-1(XXVIII) chain [Corchorus olitorius]
MDSPVHFRDWRGATSIFHRSASTFTGLHYAGHSTFTALHLTTLRTRVYRLNRRRPKHRPAGLFHITGAPHIQGIASPE